MKRYILFFLPLIMLNFSIQVNGQNLQDGLVVFYPFNNNANDESGNGNDCISVDGATPTIDRFGNPNSAYDFDGNDDKIITPIDSGMTNAISLCVWYKVRTYDVGASLISARSLHDGGYNYSGLDLSNNQNDVVQFSIKYGTGILIVDEKFRNDEWHFVVGTYDGSIMKLYGDGDLLASHAASGDIDLLYNYIIGYDNSTHQNRYFDGIIDDVRIYNRALSEQEVQELFNEGSWNLCNGLVAYYPFNGNANDESGNNINGTIFGETMLTSDRFANPSTAYFFDGFDDYITTEHSDLLNFCVEDFTVVAWIRTDDITDGNEIIEKMYRKAYPSLQPGFFLRICGNGAANAALCDGTHIGEAWGNKNLADNIWHQIVVIFKRTSNMEIYIDTDLDASTSISHVGDINVTSGLFIGRTDVFDDSGERNPNYWYHDHKGEIDDVRLYNRALNQDEILELYCANGWCNEPPIAICQDVTVSAGTACEANVTPEQVDNGSYDPDGDPITLSLDPEGPYPLGTTEVTFTVTDDNGASASCPATITVTGGSGTFSGTVSVNSNGLAGVTVKLLGNLDPTEIVDFTTTGEQGDYIFEEVSLGEYQVMIVEPLGYSSDQNFVVCNLECGDTVVVDFNLTETVVTNNARGKGYWKHQFDVYVSGKGQAKESESDLENYIAEVHCRYTPHFSIFVDLQNFEDWQAVLSVKGNAGMEAKAKSHLAALVLNIMSLKVAQYEAVTEDNYTAGDVLTYVSELLPDEDFDPSNDELAKNLAEKVNEQQTIDSGQVHPSKMILYKNAGNPLVEDESLNIPDKYTMYQNYPNPFNPTTKIAFDLPEAAFVKITVYDIQGREITNIIHEYRNSGRHTIEFNGSNLASGIYYYKLLANDFSTVRKFVITK